jgi:hypothetical protein
MQPPEESLRAEAAGASCIQQVLRSLGSREVQVAVVKQECSCLCTGPRQVTVRGSIKGLGTCQVAYYYSPQEKVWERGWVFVVFWQVRDEVSGS